MNVIVPYDNELYNDYIERLLKERQVGLKNKPVDFYTEGHHILPRCMNGNDSDSNIIILLPEEHYYCHKLLALENSKITELQFAWWQMCHKSDGNTKRKYFVSPEEYAEARRRFALIVQKMNGIPVVDIDNKITYPSASAAARACNMNDPTNIIDCCKKKIHSIHGYRFCYLSDYIKGNYEKELPNKLKKIIDLDSKEIYDNVFEAESILNIPRGFIWATCRHNMNSAKGHRFAYYEDYLQGNYELKPIVKRKQIVQDIDTGIIYESAAEAQRQLNIDSSEILKVCKGKQKSAKGHRFIYYSKE